MQHSVRTNHARSHLHSVLLVILLTGCVTPDIGGPTAPGGDSSAGILTLPSGRSLAVCPEQLAYTGTASYQWPDGRSYEGDFSDGKAHGMGSEQLPDGERYRGTWVAGKRHGHGELRSADGQRYVGDFAAGKRSGQGSQYSAAGLYSGSWRNDTANGFGEYFGNDGSRYSGQWQNGQRHGVGRYEDGQGNSYDGDWSADSPEGFGIMVNADGSRYEGQRTRNMRNGYGRLEAGGFSYEGTWLAGKRHGYGLSRSPDGSSYLGEWQNGNRHGLGRASNADGSYHDGEWQHDRTVGPGTRVDTTGIEISGVWNDDVVPSGLLLLPTGRTYAGGLIKRNGVIAPALIRWLEQAAAENDPYASLFLGRIYSNYVDPAPDLPRAREAYLAAASAGIVEGAYQAALLSDENTGAEQRIRLLMNAADAGHIGANVLLGEYYATGRYVSPDTSVAVTYFARASDSGDLGARNNLAWILATYPDGLIRDGDRAVELMAPLVSLYDNWQHLDTLAAALAETGDFAAAAATQQRAIDHLRSAAPGQTDTDVYHDMQERLQRYQRNEPFREYRSTTGTRN
jgi:TPR repeat protein